MCTIKVTKYDTSQTQQLFINIISNCQINENMFRPFLNYAIIRSNIVTKEEHTKYAMLCT
jgi:hypothetical protein